MTGPEAVAEVIKATGFTALAKQYLEEPHHRDRIRAAVTRIIAKDYGKEKAHRFSVLAAASRMV